MRHNIPLTGRRGEVKAHLADISDAVGFRFDNDALAYIRSTIRHATASMPSDVAVRLEGMTINACIWSVVLAQFLLVELRYDGGKAWSLAAVGTPTVEEALGYFDGVAGNFYPFARFSREETQQLAQRAVAIIERELASPPASTQPAFTPEVEDALCTMLARVEPMGAA